MEKTIKKEVLFCDKCNKEGGYLTPCMLCGTEMCFDCYDKHGKKYRHSVHFSGSGDGFYCKPCDNKLTKAGDDKRHGAYRAVEALRLEMEAWSVDFGKRQEAAEAQVKALSR